MARRSTHGPDELDAGRDQRAQQPQRDRCPIAAHVREQPPQRRPGHAASICAARGRPDLSRPGERPIRGREPAARAYTHDPTTHPAPDPGRLDGRRNGPRPVQPERPRHRRGLRRRDRLRLVAPRADHPDRQRRPRHPADADRLRDRPRHREQRVREFRVVLRPARKHKFKFDYLPISYEIVGPRPGADHRVQRPVLHGRGAGERRRRVHHPEDRLRVRLPLQRPRLPRLHPRHEDHAGPDRFRQPDQRRVRRGDRADPDGRPRRPRLRRRATSPSAASSPSSRSPAARIATTTARTSTTTSTGPSTSPTTSASPAAGGSWISTTRSSATSARSICAAGTSMGVVRF